MTSHEILKSDLLDILFENRNKQYGAYALRRFYANRVGTALAISLSSVLLLLFFIRPSSSTPSSEPTIGIVEVTPFELPKIKEPEPDPPATNPQVITNKATIKYQSYQIVPDVQADPTLPTTDDIAHAVISNVTTAGDADDNQPMPSGPVVANGTGVVPTTPTPVETFDPIEQQPEFPGGAEAWLNFLNRHLQAPGELEAGERKTVQVRFMVSATGEVTDFEVVQSAGSSYDREVIRVLKRMPRWKPAIQNGHAIGVSFVQPVTFQGVEE